VRALIVPLAVTAFGIAAAPARAQNEYELKRAFEGKFVIVKMDMPATQYGIDLVPGREPAVDFKAYSQRVKQYGIALRAGDRVMVTTIRIKKKNIEFQLGGGGYGTFGDDSGYVYVVSMHVYRPYDSRQQVTGLVRRMVAGLVPLEPR